MTRRTRAARCLALFAVLLATGVGCEQPVALAGSTGWMEFFGGFAAPSDGLLLGRIHRGSREATPRPAQSRIRRVLQTLDSLEADPLRGVAVAIHLADRPPVRVRSDDRGYIELSPIIGLRPPQGTVRLQVEDARFAVPAVDGVLPVYDSQPGLAVISDIDDTLLDTGVVDKLKMAENAVTRSTWELQAFPGAAGALQTLAGGRPLFYVSGSPWGFYDRIRSYLERSGFPVGTFLLKRFSSEPLLDQQAFKWGHIARVVAALPQKRWLLLGDSGEKDPEIYARLRQQHPDRVEAIYIHLVTPEDSQSPRFAGMRVFRDWSEVIGAPASTGAASASPPATPR